MAQRRGDANKVTKSASRRNSRVGNPADVQRLERELAEAVEQQAATADILRVIASSPADADAVFEMIASNAFVLCNALFANVFRYRDGMLHYIASQNVDKRHRDLMNDIYPMRPDKTQVSGRVALSGEVVKLEDTRSDSDYDQRFPTQMGWRRILGVPMLRDGKTIGVIVVGWKKAGPIPSSQEALLRSFADQAVIAIGNTNLLEEIQTRNAQLTEALEQQTATADVLKVISRSAFDLQTVLDTLCESAARLCQAENAWIFRRHGEDYRFAASFGFSPNSHAAIKAYLEPLSIRPGPGTLIGRTANAGKPVHVEDVLADSQYTWTELQRIAGYRSVVGVPLLRNGESIGIMALSRGHVQPFSEKQVELAVTFADQAVIAIENTRLFEEVQARTADLQESLEYQTATSEVLSVISRSPSEIQPVFDAIVATAKRLCDASDSHILRLEDGVYKLVAYLQTSATAGITHHVLNNPVRPGQKGSVSARAASQLRPVHVPDSTLDPECDQGLIGQGGRRAILGVPLVRDGIAIGIITLQRDADRPFTQKHIDLVSTFADQAVIAINNVELFEKVEAHSRDLGEALQQQIATAEVLKVISRSAFDLETVLNTLVEAAVRLCRADQGTVAREHEGAFVRAASFGFSEEFDEAVRMRPVERERGSATGRALTEGTIVHIPDVQADPEYTFDPGKRLGGFRAILAVPMLREEEAIGVFALTRKKPQAFTDREIELLSTFVDQAAIAIDNVRLFQKAEARSRELVQSLEELRAAQDRLVQTEKLASLGQLTAGIAHEIKNPLNFVNNFSSVSTELLEELRETLAGIEANNETMEDIREVSELLRGNLEKIVHHGKRADSIVRNMLLHARQGSAEHRPADINAIVEESVNLAYHGARAEKQGFNITLETELDPEAGEIDVYAQEITRVLLNLISNAFYAAMKRKAEGREPDYEPALRTTTRKVSDGVEISIRDNGIGIPADVRTKLFAPFFTTKPAGEGTGLGLSISHDIVVKQHRGRIEVDSEPGRYTEFRVFLPRTGAAEAAS